MTESQYNLIFIDVDNKSTKEGLSCPPPDFLDKSRLEYFKSKMAPCSVFVLNLVCRNEELKKGYMSRVRQLFPVVMTCDVPHEVNTLLFCFSQVNENSSNTKSVSALVKQSITWLSSGCIDSETVSTTSSNSQQSGKTKDNKKKKQNITKSSLFPTDPFCGILDEAEKLSGYFKILKL
jgi:hypothetical protein